jgi:hypothetical protein
MPTSSFAMSIAIEPVVGPFQLTDFQAIGHVGLGQGHDAARGADRPGDWLGSTRVMIERALAGAAVNQFR